MVQQKKILILEDDPVAVKMISQVLSKSGYSVNVAEDGYTGLSKVKELTPDLIVCDVIMPRLDGFAFCRDVIQNYPQISIIMMSGEQRVKDVFLSVGVKAFFLKPIDTGKLVEEVKKLIGAPPVDVSQKMGVEEKAAREEEQLDLSEEKTAGLQPQQQVPQKPEPAAKEAPPRVETDETYEPPVEQKDVGKGKKILVVDDEEHLQKVIQQRLKSVGFEVFLAENGLIGLEKVGKAKPDLIITDVLMPEMDGFAFYKELKSNDETASIPVIILSAREKMEDSFRVLGAEHFVKKPYNPQELIKKICELAHLSSQAIQKPAGDKAPEEKKDEEKKPEPEEKEATPKEEKQKKPQAKKNGPKKVILYGSEPVTVGKIRLNLENEKCQVYVEKDVKRIIDKVQSIIITGNKDFRSPISFNIVKVRSIYSLLIPFQGCKYS